MGFGGSSMVQMDRGGRCGHDGPIFREIGGSFVSHATIFLWWTAGRQSCEWTVLMATISIHYFFVLIIWL